MKLLHLSDLHLGKRVNEFSMLEDQAYILQQILKITEEERPDAVLIAGDIYDKSVPPAEAVQLFDDFLYQLSKGGWQVFLISGNFDFAVFIQGKSMREVAMFVSEKLSTIDGVLSTSTQFILKRYKDHGTVIEAPKKDERIAIS